MEEKAHTRLWAISPPPTIYGGKERGILMQVGRHQEQSRKQRTAQEHQEAKRYPCQQIDQQQAAIEIR